MRRTMSVRVGRSARSAAALLWVGLAACSGPLEEGALDAMAKGPHGGRLLRSDGFELELAIVESGMPPEFRAWATKNREAVDLAGVTLEVELSRLGGRVDHVAFRAEGPFLRGQSTVEEPHSFEVAIEATHEGVKHVWRYESLEGRTRIEPTVAADLGLETAIAGPVVLSETVTVHGRVRPNAELTREIWARFAGMIRKVSVSVGDSVSEGDLLMTVESDESLRAYRVLAPISGVVTERDANSGEHTAGRRLLTIVDTSKVWVDLSIFPDDRAWVRPGTRASIVAATGGEPRLGVVAIVDVLAQQNQAVTARVVLDDPEGQLPPGSFVRAELIAEEHPVPLAVRKSALQAFRDFTVVYAQVGDEYEVRMLELGHEGGGWVEVRAGLEPGTRYVTTNSHLIKADLGAAGATHDH